MQFSKTAKKKAVAGISHNRLFVLVNRGFSDDRRIHHRHHHHGDEDDLHRHD